MFSEFQAKTLLYLTNMDEERQAHYSDFERIARRPIQNTSGRNDVLIANFRIVRCKKTSSTTVEIGHAPITWSIDALMDC